MRRVTATAAVTLFLTSCGFAGTTPRHAPSGSDTADAGAESALPAVSAFEVAEGEPAPDVKRAAVRFLEGVLNYEEGEGTPEAARERLDAADVPANAVGPDTSLLMPDAAAAAQVVYPQLGGLTKTQASIMAVVEFTVLREEERATETRTVDLRLEQGGEGWEVTEIASEGGSEPDTGTGPTGAAERVLASDRIDLPDSARWDILAGEVDDRTLEMMLALAADHELSVTTLSTGHPRNVFDSDSVSNHIHGRAVDIWAVDGVSVSDLRRREDDANPARTLMELALQEGATEVGGPWSLSLSEGSSFTDTVHEDHLHIGFKQ